MEREETVKLKELQMIHICGTRWWSKDNAVQKCFGEMLVNLKQLCTPS